jgi:hypothetical protein
MINLPLPEDRERFEGAVQAVLRDYADRIVDFSVVAAQTTAAIEVVMTLLDSSTIRVVLGGLNLTDEEISAALRAGLARAGM